MLLLSAIQIGLELQPAGVAQCCRRISSEYSKQPASPATLLCVQDMKDMVKHYVGLTVSDAKMLDMDRLGITLQCTRNEQSFKVRLPFIR